MKEHVKKYAIGYILLALAVGIFIGTQWSTIMGWFTPSADGTTDTEGGRLSSEYVRIPVGSTNKQTIPEGYVECCTVGGYRIFAKNCGAQVVMKYCQGSN